MCIRDSSSTRNLTSNLDLNPRGDCGVIFSRFIAPDDGPCDGELLEYLFWHGETQAPVDVGMVSHPRMMRLLAPIEQKADTEVVDDDVRGACLAQPSVDGVPYPKFTCVKRRRICP